LIDLDPNYSKAYTNLGVCLILQGQTEKAMQYFDRAVELDPYDPIIWQNLLTIYKQMGDRENAYKAFNMLKQIQQRRF
jgi:tetratricopeptide (TPR) repeat protein